VVVVGGLLGLVLDRVGAGSVALAHLEEGGRGERGLTLGGCSRGEGGAGWR
jgi:hypothetical protein